MNTLSAILWNPDIEIFSIFGISIRYYSVLFVTGLSLAYWVIYKLYQDQKIPYEKFDEKGFVPLYNIKTGWKNIDGKDIYAKYIIWENIK